LFHWLYAGYLLLISLSTVTQSSLAERGHLVEFYETEEFLLDTVRAFLLPALREGDAVIVGAGEGGRERIAAALGEAGVDVEAAVGDGRYVAFDPVQSLSRLMVDGEPNPARFHETIGHLMDVASQGGRRVRAYGEMVTMLWEARDVTSAMALERLWNGFMETRPLDVLCAYPMQAFEDKASADQFKSVCEQHSRVIPSESFSLLADPDDRSRAVAEMQQRTGALYAEVRRLRAQQRRASHDDLTGVYLREAGFVELEREIVRANRTGLPLVVAFADVDRLKEVNDKGGHAAGDRMLVKVVRTFRRLLRSYDLIIRYGGDEFVCAMSDLDMEAAAKRIRLVNTALAASTEHGSVTVGLAELRAGDSPEDLVARADAALYRERQCRRDAAA
jgi:diguanylate cyclase (GGDEF)-like protein